MFQTFISRHNSNFFSDKLVLTSVTPASSAPVLQTPKRSEERFSRNAETDLVCRLLLEKKKVRDVLPPVHGRNAVAAELQLLLFLDDVNDPIAAVDLCRRRDER